MKNTIFSAATLALAVTAAPALAGPDNEPQMRVNYADLDLTSKEGQAALERRVESAAKTVCKSTVINTGSRIRSRASRECLAKARLSAKRQVAAAIADRQRGG
ncbi:MAG: UrcA family protein [Pseudomonadota bacterium]